MGFGEVLNKTLRENSDVAGFIAAMNGSEVRMEGDTVHLKDAWSLEVGYGGV